MNLFKMFSITGIVFAILFLVLSISVFYLSRDARGNGATLQLFFTFPWFFISLAFNFIPFWVWIIPNAIVCYFAGYGLEALFKKIFF